MRDAHIDLYVSYGTSAGGVTVHGRLLAGTRPPLGQMGDRRRKRLRATWRAFRGGEILGARVEVSLLQRWAGVRTDEDGFFEARFVGPLPIGEHVARASLDSEMFEAERQKAPVFVYPPDEGLAVISDIDDTIVITDVSRKLRMLRRVLLSTPEHLETYAGAPELYARFAAAGWPVLFISGSPWPLEPRLRAFFELRGFPAAPMLLKDLGLGPRADSFRDNAKFKRPRIADVMAALPLRRFLLLGDSGDQDPEIYGAFQRERPERVAGVFIHRVTEEPADAPRFAGAFVFDDFEQLARELETRGLSAK